VTFSHADLEGTWNLNGFGAYDVFGFKYTGVISFDANGLVTGGSAGDGWSLGSFIGGGLSVSGPGHVSGIINGASEAGVFVLTVTNTFFASCSWSRSTDPDIGAV